MEIYNEQMERMENPDLTLGWLEDSLRTVHHDAIEAVEAVWHYEVIAEYPNGGRDVHRVIDRPGVEGKDAWDEQIAIRIYHPYTQEELAHSAQRPTMEERMGKLEEMMDALHGRMETVMAQWTKLAQKGETQ